MMRSIRSRVNDKRAISSLARPEIIALRGGRLLFFDAKKSFGPLELRHENQ